MRRVIFLLVLCARLTCMAGAERVSYFVSNGETVDQIVKTYYSNSSADSRVYELLRKANPHITLDWKANDELPEDQVVIVPDLDVRSFNWLFCVRFQEFKESMRQYFLSKQNDHEPSKQDEITRELALLEDSVHGTWEKHDRHVVYWFYGDPKVWFAANTAIRMPEERQAGTVGPSSSLLMEYLRTSHYNNFLKANFP